MAPSLFIKGNHSFPTVMEYLEASTLKDRVVDDLGLEFYPDIYDLLSHTSGKGILKFKDIVKRTINEFNRIFPTVLCSTLTGTSYTFVDNFSAYLSGDISEASVELIPVAIARLGRRRFTSGIFFSYSRPTITTRYSTSLDSVQCTYFAPHPYVLEVASDNEFTEESRIYYMDDNYQEYFMSFLSYNVGLRIEALVKSVDLGLPVSILSNLSTTLDTIRERKEDDIASSTVVLEIWRK